MKDPPDKYRCLKLPLSSILYKTDDAIVNLDILQDAISRANDIRARIIVFITITGNKNENNIRIIRRKKLVFQYKNER